MTGGRAAHDHWQSVYGAKQDAELSWFEEEPRWSLELVRGLPRVPASAIDVGGGQSALAGALLRLGVQRVAVLDLAEAALERGKARAGSDAGRIEWIAADIRECPSLGPFELWHDRACLHFLTEAAERSRYAALAAQSVVSGGFALIAVFGPEGPERCSGLPVRRTTAEALAAEFSQAFTLERTMRVTHATPWGKPQAFVYALLKRV
jgi:predicted RNA methylase